MSRIKEIIAAFTKLGFTSFGGPVAHMSFFRAEFVEKRKWLSESEYADLVALCQFLPGPSSSQVGFGLGVQRAGLLGGLAAFICFTLPSAIYLILAALYTETLANVFGPGLISGLKIVATAVVAHAILGMAMSLCKTKITAAIAVVGLLIVTLVAGALGQIGAIIFGAAIGLFFIEKSTTGAKPIGAQVTGKTLGANVSLVLFAALLLGLPALSQVTSNFQIQLLDSFYRAGALVFGGGHVVLPLLETEMVSTGIVDRDAFLAGYGLTQAAPGPIFSFAAFLGTASAPLPLGLWQAALATLAIFLPGFLLVYAILPRWEQLRAQPWAKPLLAGANAAVVGLLAGAFYTPIWQSTVNTTLDFAFVAVAFVLLTVFRIAPWLLVILGGAVGSLMGFL